MEKSSDDQTPSVYTPPTREAVVRAMYSDGIYITRCKKCNEKVRGRNMEEINAHKCRGS